MADSRTVSVNIRLMCCCFDFVPKLFRVFGLPGVGRYFIEGALNRDYTLVMGTVVLIAIFVIVFNLLVDVVYAMLDPRVRYE